MNRLLRLSYLLFSIFFSTCIGKNITFEAKIISSPWSSCIYPTEHHYSQDGFLANSLIQTPFGYRPIHKLMQGDSIIDFDGKQKKIIAITKNYVNRYIKLVVDDTSIYTGYDQQYYMVHPDKWMAAHSIKKDDLLINNANNFYAITSIELINENTLLYCLAVEDHIFCIAPHNVCVHNAEALICGVSSTCLGHIIIINPIITTIGATIALSVIAHRAYQEYAKNLSENTQTNSLPTEAILAERSYYIERSIALETVKKELAHIKNGLENLKALCDIDSSATFTYQFLKQTTSLNRDSSNQLLQISAAQEMQLSDDQKVNLRALREIELEQLEKEIITLQARLALHINQLIEHIFNADNEYKNAKKEVESATTLWNNNRDRMTDVIALQSYKANLLEEHLLNNLNQKITELKIVAHYYNNCMNSSYIKKSTNIFDLLEKIDSAITEYGQCIEQEKARIAHNIFASESYFIHRDLSIGSIKNEIKNYLEKGKHARNTQAIAEAKNKLENIIAAGSPQNNNNNNDDDEKDHIKEKKSLKTIKDATEAAEKLGFKRTKYWSKDQPVFKKGNRYITPDRTSHNGGVWKMADSVKNLGSKITRMGTYDASLNWIGK